jgi:transcriptional regulator with XRE-family HTH domain
MADDVRPIGAALAAAREARGLSVEDVAAATRIRASIVRAIEREDFDACGGDVYARGHLRVIAQLVGTDPRPLVEEFDRRSDEPPPSLRTSPLGSFEPPRDASRSGRQSPRWALAAACVLTVAVVFLGVSWLVGREPGPGTPVGAAPGPVTTTATPSRTPVRTTPPARPPRPSGLVLGLRADGGSSWLSVTNSGGAALFEGILSDGQAKQFRDARRIDVRFGNSPAVKVTVNGREVGSPRCDRQVCTVSFAPSSAG